MKGVVLEKEEDSELNSGALTSMSHLELAFVDVLSKTWYKAHQEEDCEQPHPSLMQQRVIRARGRSFRPDLLSRAGHWPQFLDTTATCTLEFVMGIWHRLVTGDGNRRLSATWPEISLKLNEVSQEQMASLADKAVVGALCMDGTERIRPVCPFSPALQRYWSASLDPLCDPSPCTNDSHNMTPL